MADKGDLRVVDGDDLCRARSRTLELLSHFSEAFRAPKTFSFLAASLLKVKKLQTPRGKLVLRSEADGSDLCVADSG